MTKRVRQVASAALPMHSQGSQANELSFLAGDGEMVRRVRAHDWASTPLGPIESWPQSLKMAVGLMLASPQATFIAWGVERTWLNNDAFIPILGDKHPSALGLPSPIIWREASPQVGPLFDRVYGGQSVQMDDIKLMLDRRGRLEEAHFAFSYTPLRDESGAVAGLFANCLETTAQVAATAELRMAERALRQSEERTWLAAEAAGIGFWESDRIAGTLYWSPRVKAMYGMSPDYAVTREDRIACLHPDDRAASIAAYMAACDPDKRTPYDSEYRTIGKEDHVVRWVASRGRAEFDEKGRCLRVIGAATDVTARKSIEKRLRELNETLEQRVEAETRERLQIWNVSQDLLVVADPEGKCLSINPAWTTTLGWSESDLLGRTSEWLLHPDDREKSRTELSHLAAGRKTSRFENRLRDRDGAFRWISWKAVPDGGRIYAMGRDITELKDAENKLRETRRELALVGRRTTLAAMSAAIAHEIKQPLTGIVTSANAGLRWLNYSPPNLDKTRSALNNIAAGGRRASEVLQSVRAMFSPSDQLGTRLR